MSDTMDDTLHADESSEILDDTRRANAASDVDGEALARVHLSMVVKVLELLAVGVQKLTNGEHRDRGIVSAQIAVS
jgi:hypothetical protein